ncbi:MAG: carboxylate--amine ligase [Turneriella sp.]|nr:carboxylate--amine ligase [Turneriella sp.]
MPMPFNWRQRRLFYSSWLRLRNWEFWPPWLFYIPVGFYFIFLAIRYRSLTLFTASNPGIEDGGVVGESKSAILSALAGAKKNIARFTLLPSAAPARRLAALSDFMRREKLPFPVVLKPDAGERGNEVAIIRSAAEASAYLAVHGAPVIAQEYIPGLEFGVFYFRFPESEHGEIFAITDKRFPVLTGDGVSTLADLILSDARAVTMARFHLQKFAARRAEVIPAGHRFALVELGTHCKGSLFLDGGHLVTEQLRQKIDAISRQFEGFYFGRYDIRVPSLADFQQGKNLKIVELNGVTSEATSIYDPRHSLWHAYGVLCRQWSLAFEIGRQNALLGAKVTPLSVLLRRLRGR